MPQGRFFYSRNGTDVVGPVTEDDLRRLWKENQIGTGSLLWREGESHWTRLARDPPAAPQLQRVRSTKIVPSEVFASVMKAPVEIVPLAPDNTVALSPPPLTAEPLPAEPADDVDGEIGGDDVPFAVVVNTLAGMAAVAGILISFLLAPPAPANEPADLSHRLGGLAGLVAVIVFVPYLLARCTRGTTRVVFRAVLITGAALVSIAVTLSQSGYSLLAEAPAMSDQQKREAQKEIARKGPSTGDASQAGQNIQKLKGRLTDDSEASRIGRDILAVTNDLLEKVKASDTIETNCKFTLDGVKSADDLAGQITTILMLRSAQNDVVIFLEGYDRHCRDALVADHIAPAMQDDVIAGAHKGAHVDQLIVLWQEKMKLSDDHVARFAFLQKNWGRWEFANGQVSFTVDTQAAAYDLLVDAIQDDVDRIRDTQRQIFQ